MDEWIIELMSFWVVRLCLSFSVVEDSNFVNLINNFAPGFAVPSRITQRRILQQHKEVSLQQKSYSHSIQSFTLNTDAWSSRVMKGYIAITIHWIDSDWCLQSSFHDIRRFPTPRTGHATAALLAEVTGRWEIASKVKAVTADKDSAVCKHVALLRNMLNEQRCEDMSLENFHVRCIAHIIYFEVKECLSIFTTKLVFLERL